jgi:hypothetical protein
MIQRECPNEQNGTLENGRYSMNRKIITIILALVFLAWIVPGVVFAEAKLVWDASSGEVTGYRVYYGLSQGSHPNSRDVGNVTECLLSNLPLEENKTYYFVTRAYNGAGESGDSNEVSWQAPDMTAPLPPQGVTAQ